MKTNHSNLNPTPEDYRAAFLINADVTRFFKLCRETALQV